jgi:hypothetical protein
MNINKYTWYYTHIYGSVLVFKNVRYDIHRFISLLLLQQRNYYGCELNIIYFV